jgi:endothelin-converting enzyme
MSSQANAPSTNGGAHEAADENTPLIGNRGEGTQDGEGLGESQNGDVDGAGFAAQVKRWRQQRWISFAVSLVLMTIVIVLLVLFGIYRSRSTVMAHGLCLTPACVHAASEILYNLSPKYQDIDACTNFDALVCDGWRANHDPRPDQGSIGTFNSMAEDGASLLRHILEAPYPNASSHSHFSPGSLSVSMSSIDQDNFEELQRGYNACMDLDGIRKVGIDPLIDLLVELEGVYPEKLPSPNPPQPTFPPTPPKPPVPPVENVSFGMPEVMIFLRNRGIGGIVDIGVGADDKNPDDVVIMASPPFSAGLPAKSYYESDAVLAKYKAAIGAVFNNLVKHAPTIMEDYSELAGKVVDLEKQLSEHVPELEDLYDVTKSYNVMSVQETAKLAPQLGLEQILEAFVPKDYKLRNMITSFPEYLKSVSTILDKTPRVTLQAYFVWRATQSLAGAVESDDLKPYTQFINLLQGKDADATPERWRTCVAHVKGTLGWYLSRFYIEAAFSAKAKDLGNGIIKDIKDQFISRIKTLDWMDDEVKDLAIKKVNKIVQKVGYPDASPDIMDPKGLRDYYKGLNVSSSFFDNVLASRKFASDQSWNDLGKPTDRAQWAMYSPEVNAYYNPPGNEIVFPAGIMQFPVFGEELPSYINYGAFGAVAGHELSHAFDNSGRHYDVDGKYANWWTNDTINAFEDRAECFVDQYSKFTAPGPNGTTLHVNGRQTLGENIADAGGLTAAYDVWQKHRESYPDKDLPGLAEYFTQEQLFYIAYGSFWCSKYTDSALQRTIVTDPHSPNYARIEGAAMQNSRGFREAFGCKQKEPVCELW